MVWTIKNEFKILIYSVLSKFMTPVLLSIFKNRVGVI